MIENIDEAHELANKIEIVFRWLHDSPEEASGLSSDQARADYIIGAFLRGEGSND